MCENAFRLHQHAQMLVVVQNFHRFQQWVGRVLLAPQNLQKPGYLRCAGLPDDDDSKRPMGEI